MKTRKLDTLIVFGALDNAQSHHAPIVSDLISTEKLDHLELKMIPHVGHQLGPEVEGLVGPISQQSRSEIAEWLANRIATDGSGNQ